MILKKTSYPAWQLPDDFFAAPCVPCAPYFPAAGLDLEPGHYPSRTNHDPKA